MLLNYIFTSQNTQVQWRRDFCLLNKHRLVHRRMHVYSVPPSDYDYANNKHSRNILFTEEAPSVVLYNAYIIDFNM